MDKRDPRYDAEKRARARALYESGFTERAVAERMGLSRSRTRVLLDESGVQRRSRGRQRTRTKTAS